MNVRRKQSSVTARSEPSQSTFDEFCSLLREEMMTSRNWSRKSIAFALAIAVLSVYSMVALANPGQKNAGELSVSGQVTVNGQSAISGATVFSDSVITTGANSSRSEERRV